MNGTTYSFGPGGATEQPTSEWTERQTGFRSGQGIGLGLTAEEEQKLIDCLSKWRGRSYSPLGCLLGTTALIRRQSACACLDIQFRGRGYRSGCVIG